MASEAAIAFAALSTAEAQQNPYVGAWRGVVTMNGLAITMDLIMQPDMRFSEQEATYAGVSMQTGTYIIAGDQLTLNVEDFEPKTHPVYHPTGTVGGYFTYEPNAKPPGGTYRVRFLSADSFIVRDVYYLGEMRFDRVH